jgi:predicted nucleotidyltransferase
MNLILKMIHGSHLYGTNSELSDKDYKGIYLPNINDCILNRISKTIQNKTKIGQGKNCPTDVDEEIFSLQYFIQLAINGEMIVLDMLHCPEQFLIQASPIWDKLHSYRSKFYSKNLAGYLGYIRKQTAKYCVKGSRLDAMKQVLDVLSKYDGDLKLTQAWPKLPINEYSQIVTNPKENRYKFYSCCGKCLHETMSISYAKKIVEDTYNRYGDRAKAAQDNAGIDWKAVSHAFRAGLQLQEIYTTGDLKYPLKDAQIIKDIKYGKYHYVNDGIGEKLDNLLLVVEDLAKKSDFPEKIDKDFLNDFILSCY